MEFFLCIISIAFLASLFVISGIALLRSTLQHCNTHPLLEVSASYFIGLSMFIFLWRATSLLLAEANISLYTSLGCMAIAGVYFCKKAILTYRFRFSFRYVFCLLILFIITEGIVLGVWARLYSGSDHSDLYGRIALHIVSTNKFPVLGLHYGQSLLGAAIVILTKSSCYNFVLHAFLTLSLYMLMALIFSYFFDLTNSLTISSVGTFVLAFGNYALTSIHGVSISSMSPLITCGYTDDAISVGTFITTIYICSHLYFNWNLEQKLTPFFLILTAALIECWHICAPQNFVYSFAILFTTSILTIVRKTPAKKPIIFVTIFFTLVFIITSQFGGAFSLPIYQDKIENSSGIGEKKLYFQPQIPFALARTAIAPLWHIRPVYEGQFLTVTIWNIEELIWSSIRMCFFPLAGLLLLGIFLYRKYNSMLFNTFYVSAITFISGYIVTFLSGYGDFDKWGLSKFMINSYVTGMLCLVLSMSLFIKQNISRRKMRAIMIILIAIITFGPLKSVMTGVFHSYAAPPYVFTMKQRLGMLFCK